MVIDVVPAGTATCPVVLLGVIAHCGGKNWPTAGMLRARSSTAAVTSAERIVGSPISTTRHVVLSLVLERPSPIISGMNPLNTVSPQRW